MKNLKNASDNASGTGVTQINNEIKAIMEVVKTVLTPLAKSILLPLGLLAGISAAHADVQKKIYGSGSTALIISNE